MASIRLPEHSHCIYCGDPIAPGEEYCGEECRRKESERVAAEKKRDLIFYVASAGVIILLFVVRALTR